jgi:hypothetical protein
LTRSQRTALGRRINFAKSVLYMASALQDGPVAQKVSFPTVYRIQLRIQQGKSDTIKASCCFWHPCYCSLLLLLTPMLLALVLVLMHASLLLLRPCSVFKVPIVDGGLAVNDVPAVHDVPVSCWRSCCCWHSRCCFSCIVSLLCWLLCFTSSPSVRASLLLLWYHWSNWRPLCGLHPCCLILAVE